MTACESKMQNLYNCTWEKRWLKDSDDYKTELRRLCTIEMHAAEVKVAAKHADIQALLNAGSSNSTMLPKPQRDRFTRLWREIKALLEEWYVNSHVCMCATWWVASVACSYEVC